MVAAGHDFDLQQLTSELNSAVDAFNARGSNFVIDHVRDFTIVVSQYRPLAGSTYIPTPPSVERKKAIINVKNSDNRRFEIAILSRLYPAKSHLNNVCSYSKHMNSLNFDGISSQ